MILIVDDEVSIVALLGDYLKKKVDCQITTATSGQEALDLWQELNLQILITDIKMPRVDGNELIKKMRQEGFQGHILVITGHDQDNDLSDLNVAATVLKPFDLEVILSFVEKLLVTPTS